MEEALALINSNKMYKVIFKEVYNKFKNYGKITGSFVIKSKSEEDTYVLMNFDQNVLYDGKAKIKCNLVEKLFIKKLKGYSFIELMEKVIGSELKSNKEIKETEKNSINEFFETIINKSQNGKGKDWFIYLEENKSRGYNTIIRKYKEYKENNTLDTLLNELILVNNSLSKLPYTYNSKENIAVFAAKMTKNPHFFDLDTYTGKLLIHGINFILNKKSTEAVEEINELYYNVGILKDEISNHTTIFGLNAFDEDGSEIKQIKLFNEWKEPLQLSISNLLKIKYMKAENDEVYIFENPSVFSSVSKQIKNKASLICTSGQLNLSSYMIIDKIVDLKNIYYAGDFDPEGLLIADKIKQKYKDKVKFMLYDKSVYEKIKSLEPINKKRLAILENLKSEELIDIKEAINKEQNAAYQELLIDEYIKLI